MKRIRSGLYATSLNGQEVHVEEVFTEGYQEWTWRATFAETSEWIQDFWRLKDARKAFEGK